MIERKFIEQNIKEFLIQEFVTNNLKNVGHSSTKVKKTPLGEKIVIASAKPGLVIGRKGENIKKLTQTLKDKFKLENPQIEMDEVENIYLDAQIVAEKIASTLEKFGVNKFKGVGHKVMTEVMDAGALGVEIKISGKVPSSRAKSWRFYSGYLKKCGDISVSGVRKAYTSANLKSGIVGVKVRIMPPDVKLPDRITLTEEEVEEKDKKKTVKKGSSKKTRERKADKKDDKKFNKDDSAKEKKL